MQLPSREAQYLGLATDPLTNSFPGGHRVRETDEGKENEYATLVAANLLGMLSTRKHKSVDSECDPLSEDEDHPYALLVEEEESGDLDIDVVRRHSQASDGENVGPPRQTRLQARVVVVNFGRITPNNIKVHLVRDAIFLLSKMRIWIQGLRHRSCVVMIGLSGGTLWMLSWNLLKAEDVGVC